MNRELLRNLPKIDELLKEPEVIEELKNSSRSEVVDSLRETIDEYRNLIMEEKINSFSKDQILNQFITVLHRNSAESLTKVINATGTIIHTNLGRSVLSKKAMTSVINVAGNYNNVEYDIDSGVRGSRYTHVEEIIKKITGAEAALVVNNNAAAVMLVLNTLCQDKEAIVSRGQLVEIGGSFRIPEVMKLSGAKLVEVGTTNRTHLYDYENAITEESGVLLKVHTSNFAILGFTEGVSTEELVELGNKTNIPVVEDIGSGSLMDFTKYNLNHEPTVQESIKKGIDIITFSGEKMLGGPQAGIIAGKKEYINKMKKNQLLRALRIDKMTLAALEATLREYLDEGEAVKNIPTLFMMLSPKALHKERADKLKERLQSINGKLQFYVESDFSVVGGGSMPMERIETYVIKVKSSLYTSKQIENSLRLNAVPVIVRVYNREVILDMRTIFDEDFSLIVEAFKSIRV